MIETSCLCGDVRLRIAGDPTAGFWCHCTECRLAHGAAYIGVALYQSDAVAVATGDIGTFAIRSLPRSFCRRCGAQMFACVPDSELTGVVAARLPTGAFVPAFHIHCLEAINPVQDDLPHYQTMPGLFGGDDAKVDW